LAEAFNGGESVNRLLSNIWVRKISAFILVLMLAACVRHGGEGPAFTGTFAPTEPAQMAAGAAALDAQKIFAANTQAGETGKNEDYKIAPLDVIDISVFGVQELSRRVQVSSSGMISLPLIKTVTAGGRTTGELERDIAAKLDAGYLQSPQVSVFVKEYNSQRITIDGAVNKPGIFPMTGKVSLIQAVALASGLSPLADPSGVLVFRQVNNQRTAARFDLRQVRSGKIADPILQAGDIVMVDESATRTTLRDIREALPLSGLFSLVPLL
jgi:polysaccharide biosynthesis/export protein